MNFGMSSSFKRFSTIYGFITTYKSDIQTQQLATSNIQGEKTTFLLKNTLFFSDDIFDGELLLHITSFQLKTLLMKFSTYFYIV